MGATRVFQKRIRFVVLLPLCAMFVTSGLWLGARPEFSSSCLDCVPIPLQFVGILNGPVAILAYPFYPLAHGHTSAWHLAVILVAIALQWAYIGRIIDSRRRVPLLGTFWRLTCGVLGILLAFGPLAVAMRMYHVGLVYKVVALVWSALMVYHFFGFFRHVGTTTTSPSVSPQAQAR